jgi:hypothetical protein
MNFVQIFLFLLGDSKSKMNIRDAIDLEEEIC